MGEEETLTLEQLKSTVDGLAQSLVSLTQRLEDAQYNGATNPKTEEKKPEETPKAPEGSFDGWLKDINLKIE